MTPKQLKRNEKNEKKANENRERWCKNQKDENGRKIFNSCAEWNTWNIGQRVERQKKRQRFTNWRRDIRTTKGLCERTLETVHCNRLDRLRNEGKSEGWIK